MKSTNEAKFKLGSEMSIKKDNVKTDCPRGVAILPTGRLSLKTGEHKYFNVAENGQSVIEVWKVSSYKSTMFKTEEKISYRFVVTSGNSPIYEIGSKVLFIHDQTRRELFTGIMVDYIDANGFERLKENYGSSGASYVYK